MSIFLRFNALLVIVLSLSSCDPHTEYIFQGIKGPKESSEILSNTSSSLELYSQGLDSRFAILLTDPDSGWLGLAHGLKSRGIPFLITQDFKQAMHHRVVLAYPYLSGKNIDAPKVNEIRDFVSQGGTLIACNVLGSVNEIFGFKNEISSRSHTTLTFSRHHPLSASLLHPEEQTLFFNTLITHKDDRFGTTSYLGLKDTNVIATYEDGSAAIIQKYSGKGQTIAFGMDLGYLMLRSYNNRQGVSENAYVNGFNPTVDIFLNLLKKIYTQNEKNAVTLWTVPFNKSLSVVLTHDIDSLQSLKNAAAYADFEVEKELSATYFMQVKYVKDYNDEIFFKAESLPFLQELVKRGMEIGSHSVCHSRQYAEFPLGTGREEYPEYKPIVHSRKLTTGGTILGELRISKFLIESCVNPTPVVSFRPGYLSNPVQLPESLAATGYLYSSSVTANNAWTHLPFQLNYTRGYQSDVPIYEFPLTIEDESPPLLGNRVESAVELAKKISNYGGIYVVLIHPDITGHKLDFEKKLYEEIKHFSWFGSLKEFGRWWAARDKINIDVEASGDHRILHITNVRSPIPELTLHLPMKWQLSPTSAHQELLSYEEGVLMIKQAEEDLHITFKAND